MAESILCLGKANVSPISRFLIPSNISLRTGFFHILHRELSVVATISHDKSYIAADILLKMPCSMLWCISHSAFVNGTALCEDVMYPIAIQSVSIWSEFEVCQGGLQGTLWISVDAPFNLLLGWRETIVVSYVDLMWWSCLWPGDCRHLNHQNDSVRLKKGSITHHQVLEESNILHQQTQYAAKAANQPVSRLQMR